MLRFAVVIVKVKEGYSAYVPDLPGCMVTGPDLDELRRDIKVAISFKLASLRKEGGEIAPTTLCEYAEVQTLEERPSAVRRRKAKRTGSRGMGARGEPLAKPVVFKIRDLEDAELWWSPSNGQRIASANLQIPQGVRVYMRSPWGRVLDMDYVLIPAGHCKIGSPDIELGRNIDEELHRIELTKTYYMQATQVTHAEWEALMQTRPWRFTKAGNDSPVERVTWFDALEYCNRLSELEHLGKVYDLTSIRRRDDGSIQSANVETDMKQPGFRLPSEAEWEYACRAGSSTAIYTGELEVRGAFDGPELDSIAWYAGNSGVNYGDAYDSSGWANKQFEHTKAGPHGVGQKRPNELGLYDMIGNVWEWCWDRYRKFPNQSSKEKKRAERVFRGGAWNSQVSNCRAAARCKIHPSKRASILGFRPVRSVFGPREVAPELGRMSWRA